VNDQPVATVPDGQRADGPGIAGLRINHNLMCGDASGREVARGAPLATHRSVAPVYSYLQFA